MRARLDDGAIIVLGAMLEATRSAEKKVKTENSGKLIFAMVANYLLTHTIMSPTPPN